MVNRSTSLSTRLGMMAVGTSAVYLVPQTAQALVTTNTAQGQAGFNNIGKTALAPAAWDVDNDGSADFRLYQQSSFGVDAMVGSNGSQDRGLGWVKDPGDGLRIIRNLATTVMVGSTLAASRWGVKGSHYAVKSAGSGGGFSEAQGFATNVPGYAGFRFSHLGSTHYGWVNWTIDDTNGNMTVNSWAWENVAGAAIQVGATTGGVALPPAPVPEPESNIALLAMGAGGLLAWRRRRHALSVRS